jgi:hypothetical protein
MKLRIAFSRPKKFNIASAAIMVFTNCKFSHALIKWRSENLDTDMIYQASHGMAHFMCGKRFSSSNIIVAEYEFNLTDEQFTAVMKKCVQLAGTKYGTLQLIGMGAERLTGVKNPWRDASKTFVCSELVGEILKQLGLIDSTLDLELGGPRELEQAVIAAPGVRVVSV